jgi:hypothetical protein
MTTTYLDVLAWVASAALGFGIYDQLIKPCIFRGACYLRDSITERRKVTAKRKVQEGVQWAWGQYGSGSLTVNALAAWIQPKWKERSPFQKGIAIALEDILEIERGR